MLFVAFKCIVQLSVDPVGEYVISAGDVLLGFAWNVIVFVVEVPVTAGTINCSVYVPAAALNTTGPLTPLALNADTAAVKLVKFVVPVPLASMV